MHDDVESNLSSKLMDAGMTLASIFSWISTAAMNSSNLA
jgi:hypothetical protein